VVDALATMGKTKRGKKKGKHGTAVEGTAQQKGKVEAVKTEHEDNDLSSLFHALQPLRLIELEIALTEMLFPNNHVDDLGKWSGNFGMIESLRNLYLRKRFGTGEYVVKLKQTLAEDYLPSRQEIIELFDLKRPPVQEWKRAKEIDHMSRKKQLLLAAKTTGDRVDRWSFEDKLEALGCAIYGRGAFNLCCEDTGRYEFLTKEFITQLATYLKARVDELGCDSILEVGAGSGALTYFINSELERLGCEARCIATDPDFRAAPRQRFGITAENSSYKIHECTCERALAKFKPKIVLCSWMPMDMDWTKQFRTSKSLEEYILIGEADFGACGDNWKTWGNQAFAPVAEQGNPPPYEADGWVRTDLDDVSRWQMQRYDNDYYAGNSVTVSFRRDHQ